MDTEVNKDSRLGTIKKDLEPVYIIDLKKKKKSNEKIDRCDLSSEEMVRVSKIFTYVGNLFYMKVS